MSEFRCNDLKKQIINLLVKEKCTAAEGLFVINGVEAHINEKSLIAPVRVEGKLTTS